MNEQTDAQTEKLYTPKQSWRGIKMEECVHGTQMPPQETEIGVQQVWKLLSMYCLSYNESSQVCEISIVVNLWYCGTCGRWTNICIL